MPVGDDTYAWRRDLPHLQKSGKTYFVTFCSSERHELAPRTRDHVLSTCLSGHLVSYFLHVVTVMPDHVHLVQTPYESTTLDRTMKMIKSMSARCAGGGTLWQREYWDRAIRTDEDLRMKCEYVAMNPVRAGLVVTVEEYPWTWRSWIEGRREAPVRTPAPH